MLSRWLMVDGSNTDSLVDRKNSDPLGSESIQYSIQDRCVLYFCHMLVVHVTCSDGIRIKTQLCSNVVFIQSAVGYGGLVFFWAD